MAAGFARRFFSTTHAAKHHRPRPRGLRATGYGLRVTGYGLRVTGYGLRVYPHVC
ncbi:hypothetical protein [Acetobacter sp. LMG 32666]|uniref:hypothetical protein n=1 Tax=Acetobacter sp. LMG 32666 TaxID=2959295 RepID=UPI0030C8AD58